MIIGVVGLSHLGLVSSIAFSKKKIKVIAFDKNLKNIVRQNKVISISEPKLDKNLKNNGYLNFSSNYEELKKCHIVYIAGDIPTDNKGNSDYKSINVSINYALKYIKKETTLVIHSQVRPGFTRKIYYKHKNTYYHVETLIFGKAFDRASFPERIIIGKCHNGQKINTKFRQFIKKFNCPLIEMNYESAELAKISINMYLISSITFANYMSGLAKKLDADWSYISRALKLDKRIGKLSYLQPNIGISGGNLERDLKSTEMIALKNKYEITFPALLRKLSNEQRNWVFNIVNKKNIKGKLGILGLSYKENTNSIKNSPSCYLVDKLKSKNIVYYDPKVKSYKNLKSLSTPNEVIKSSKIIIFMTNWKIFKKIDYKIINKIFKGDYIIDPYKIIDKDKLKKNIKHFSLW